MRGQYGASRYCWQIFALVWFLSTSVFVFADDDDDDDEHESRFKISEAKWDDEKARLKVKGEGRNARTIRLFNAASMQQLGSDIVDDDEWKIELYNLTAIPCRVKVTQSDGQAAEKNLEDAPSSCSDSSTGTLPPPSNQSFAILAANDLGMHCADQDYRIFSILPPYNVLNAQVVQKGSTPKLMTAADGINVTYKAAYGNYFTDFSDPQQLPASSNSINSSSRNIAATAGSFGVFKSNFWDNAPPSLTGIDKVGFIAYEVLYPPELLATFPSTPDVGLPFADLYELYYGTDGMLTNGDEIAVVHQSAMPGLGNEPQLFKSYVKEFPFFVNFPFGYKVNNFNRFTAEGIPITTIDDVGNLNPYPLMRIEARDTANNVLATVDAVVPVASEADCAICHASQDVCGLNGSSLVCDDIANASYPNVSFIETALDAELMLGANNEQKVINSAKSNILRLHDYKHSTSLAGTEVDGSNGSTTPNVVCANCHYSPALDLVHLGPTDSNGKEQTQHITMSRAMHGVHGSLSGRNPLYADLFPTMPSPGNSRSPEQAQQILMETCYNCHPGKKAKCLRGAMGGSGTVCQDCHGQLSQVGDDFSENFPVNNFLVEKDADGQVVNVHGADLSKRVPWASEPKCDSCHVGDVLQVAQLKQNGALNDAVVNTKDSNGVTDNLRLLMSYRLSDHKTNGGPDNLPIFAFADSRFATTEGLYRLSAGDKSNNKGHGGLSCEGCHGSTHAIWPNANPYANDNKAAKDLQGHSGSIIECQTCHEGSLGNTLAGPHGMHPVGNTSFSDGGHEDMAEGNKNTCRACHGLNGEGSVLSRAATARVLSNEDQTVYLNKGDVVTCSLCHENEL